MHQWHSFEWALPDQTIDRATVDVGETPALHACEVRQCQNEASRIGNG
jgi:hypothetical protein